MNERKVWFITRPERDPHYHAEALRALAKATDNFTIKWQGNREVHKHYESVLVSYGLKRNNISNDGSGGRTWCALMKTFAYCYLNKEGYLVATKSGQALINREKEYENVKKQILTLQIPNAYFLESGFRPKFEQSFRIRPARFLIKLAYLEELDYYLTKEEITYFVLTAQNDNELFNIAEKIMNFRQSNDEEKEMARQEIAIKYDHRARNDHAARDYLQAHSDVAHTFMLLCEYTDLVEYERGDAILRAIPSHKEQALKVLEHYDERYPFNPRYKISIERMAENNGLDVDSYKASSYGQIKPASNQSKKQAKIQAILDTIPNVSNLSEEELFTYFVSSFGPKETSQIVGDIKSSNQEIKNLSSAFVENYLGNLSHSEFEKETLKIFKAIGFDAIYQPKVKGKQTEIEILLKYDDKCGIIDAKYYPNGFPLSQSFANYMASEYIPNYLNYEGQELSFYGYVTSTGFTGDKKLKAITELSKKLVNKPIEGIMLTREVLIGYLDYCLEKELSEKERIELFISKINNVGFHKLPEFI